MIKFKQNDEISQKMKDKNYISYSNVLIQFIEPLLNGTETAEEFLLKAKMGMVAWNFHVSDQYQLPYDKEMKTILKRMTNENNEGKEILNQLVLRKQMNFSKYKQFILEVKLNYKIDNTPTLYVESAPVESLKKR